MLLSHSLTMGQGGEARDGDNRRNGEAGTGGGEGGKSDEVQAARDDEYTHPHVSVTSMRNPQLPPLYPTAAQPPRWDRIVYTY